MGKYQLFLEVLETYYVLAYSSCDFFMKTFFFGLFFCFIRDIFGRNSKLYVRLVVLHWRVYCGVPGVSFVAPLPREAHSSRSSRSSSSGSSSSNSA